MLHQLLMLAHSRYSVAGTGDVQKMLAIKSFSNSNLKCTERAGNWKIQRHTYCLHR